MTTHSKIFAAIDLGASSGRVVVAIVEPTAIRIREVHRFRNDPVDDTRTLRWNIGQLIKDSFSGLRGAIELARAHNTTLSGIGIDSWGVDYVFGTGPDWTSDHHRGAPDPEPMLKQRRMDADSVYAVSGILDQAINTSLRLAYQAPSADPRLMFIPDLWAYVLTGEIGTDPTIASTSQLLDVRTGSWSEALCEAHNVSWVSLPPIQQSGDLVGYTSPTITSAIGSAAPVPVYRVAGHDTASAFAFASPAREGDQVDGLISSGTWSLVGAVLQVPHTHAASMAAGFTNERGLNGTLYLQNLNGMWVLHECVREWNGSGHETDVPELVRLAAEAPVGNQTFNMSDQRLLGRGGMVTRVQRLCREIGRQVPRTPAEVTRAILESLAASYANGLRATERTAGVHIGRIRVVGGGARNTLLCQLTADATGLTVDAGPVEASSIGNLATQIVASGTRPDLDSVYADLSGDGATITSYQPRIS